MLELAGAQGLRVGVAHDEQCALRVAKRLRTTASCSGKCVMGPIHRDVIAARKPCRKMTTASGAAAGC